MTRVALVLCALAVSTLAWAQAPTDAVEKALLAAPANLSKDATVVAFKPDYTYETIRKGGNPLVCFDRSGLPGQQPFSVECTSLGNLPRVAQNLKFEAEPDRTKRQAALDAAEKDGSRVKPEYRLGLVSPAGQRQGDGAHAHDRRGAGRHDAVNRTARQREVGWCLDHERRHEHRPSDDPGTLSSCG